MNNRLRSLLGILVGTAAIAVFIAWFLHSYERVDEEIPLPPSGEASYNPLYALKKTLQADGIEVDSRQRLNLKTMSLAPTDTLLLLEDPRALTPEQSDRLLEWVESGGHLLLRTPTQHVWMDSGLPRILRDAGLSRESHPAGYACVRWHSDDDEVASLCGSGVFQLRRKAEISLHDPRQMGLVYARLQRGAGHIDVLVDFDFLTNRQLEKEPYQALTRQILAPNYHQGVVHLIYAAQMPSLWRTVLLRGWPVWLPLTLALLAWLWRRGQPFGPLLPPPLPERRSLLEHVRASGEFLLRHGGSPLLYASVRATFFARLRRRDPIAAILTGEAQIAAIAERLNVPFSYVRNALSVPEPTDRQAFRDRVRHLIHMRNLL